VRSNPYFSIITCTYNSAQYLAETIQSIENQSFNDYEHIFIDAFSSDETISIIESYKLRHPNKVRLYQVPPHGISNAMNYGINMAHGEVVLHLHGDDTLASGKVLDLVKHRFAATNASLVVGNCMLTRGTSISYTWPNSSVRRTLLKIFFIPLMFYTNLIPHPSAYVKKSVFQRLGSFDERYKVVMDYDFWFRSLRHEAVFLMDEVLSVYRFHSNTVSTTQVSQGLDEIDRIREYYRGDFPVAYAVFVLFLQPLLVLRRLLNARASAQLPTSGPV